MILNRFRSYTTKYSIVEDELQPVLLPGRLHLLVPQVQGFHHPPLPLHLLKITDNLKAEVGLDVPQGSVLRLVLFAIFINDLDDCVKQIIDLIKEFADDTKTRKLIKIHKKEKGFQ